MGFLFRPVHGLITNNTARIMIEVSRSDNYIFTYNIVSEPEKNSTEYFFKAGKPCVLQLEGLKKNTMYQYAFFDLETGGIENGSFSTLNESFCMITPSSEIHEECDISLSRAKTENTGLHGSNSSKFAGTNSLTALNLSKLRNRQNNNGNFNGGISANNVDISRENSLNRLDRLGMLNGSNDSNISNGLQTPRGSKKTVKILSLPTPHHTSASDDLNMNNNHTINKSKHMETNFYVSPYIPLQAKYAEVNEEMREHILHQMRNVYRKEWQNLCGTNIMFGFNEIFPNTKTNSGSGSGNGKSQFINDCAREVYDEYQRGLRINNHTTLKDYFILRYGTIGYIFIDKLGTEQLEFARNNIPRCQQVQQWICISPRTLFEKSNKAKVNVFLSCFLLEYDGKLPLFVSNHGNKTAVYRMKISGKTSGYQVVLQGYGSKAGKNVEKPKNNSKSGGKMDNPISKITKNIRCTLDWNVKEKTNFLQICIKKESVDVEINYSAKNETFVLSI